MGMKPRAPLDDALLDRIRRVLGPRDDVVEKRMFGGVAFMVRGHMCVGVAKRDFMVRVGPDGYQAAMALPGARPMDFTGRPLKGFVYVDPAACDTVARVRPWVRRALAFVEELPAK